MKNMTRAMAKREGYLAGADFRAQLTGAPTYDEAQQAAAIQIAEFHFVTARERIAYRNGFVSGMLGATTY